MFSSEPKWWCLVSTVIGLDQRNKQYRKNKVLMRVAWVPESKSFSRFL